jgi:hypothetical protein
MWKTRSVLMLVISAGGGAALGGDVMDQKIMLTGIARRKERRWRSAGYQAANELGIQSSATKTARS